MNIAHQSLLQVKAELIEVVAPMDVIASRIADDPRRAKAAQVMLDVAARWER